MVLTVRTWEVARSCSDVGVTHVLTATLRAPLGDRILVDGACVDGESARPACAEGDPTQSMLRVTQAGGAGVRWCGWRRRGRAR